MSLGLDAVLLLAGLLWIPGAGLVWLLSPRRPQLWMLAALAPVLSCAWVLGGARVGEAVGLERGFEGFVLAWSTLPWLGVGLRRRLGGWSGARVREVMSRPWEVGIVGAVSAVSAASWILAARGVAILPNIDATAHGSFVRKISLLESVDPAQVTGYSAVGETIGGYYPLGLHAVAGVVHSLTSASIAALLLGVVVCFVAGVLPAGMYGLGRSIGGRQLGVLAAASTLLVPAFPAGVMRWSGIATICGVAAVPGVVGLWRGQWLEDRRWALLMGAVGGSLAVIHTSQVAAVVVLGAVLVLPVSTRSWWRGLRSGWSLAGAGIAAVVVGFDLRGILRAVGGGEVGAGEATILPPEFVSHLVGLSFPVQAASQAGHPWLPAAALILGGACVALRGPRELLLAWAVLAAVTGWAAGSLLGSAQLRVLSLPWYSEAHRVSYYLALVVMLLGSYAALVLLRRLGGGQRALAGVSAVMLGLGVATSGAELRETLVTGGIVSEAELAWPEEHPGMLAEGVSVLAGRHDGSMWLYVEDGVQVWSRQFGYVTPGDPRLRERAYLLAHIHEHPRNPLVRELVERYQIRYVIASTERFEPSFPSQPDPAVLEGSPGLRLLERAGGARLYEVVDVG